MNNLPLYIWKDKIKCPACRTEADPDSDFQRLDKFGQFLPVWASDKLTASPRGWVPNIAKQMLSNAKEKFAADFNLEANTETVDSDQIMANVSHNRSFLESSGEITFKDPKNVVKLSKNGHQNVEGMLSKVYQGNSNDFLINENEDYGITGNGFSRPGIQN